MNYAKKLKSHELSLSNKTWYLPVFVVHNQNKPSKLRLVWDAAAKSNGVSLNDFLLKGPDLMEPLQEVLFRFREKRVAISGDLKEMFHQVLIEESDRDAQRFLWRDCNLEKEPEEYVMRVMTFGAKCSPCQAQYIKNIHADKYIMDAPRAVRAIKSNHYVDDWLDSFDTVEEAIEVAAKVRKIYKAAGFDIRNWLSNKEAVLNELGEENVTLPDKMFNCTEVPTEKILGMWWRTSEDVLVFRINNSLLSNSIMNGIKVPTKRQALSAVMSIFDPLGLIASFIIYGKIILQQIWREGTDWDESISDAANSKWKLWTQRLFSIESLQIPRAYINTDFSSNMEFDLHVFVDASQDAYSAVAYIRASDFINDDEVFECALLSSKTRVAPQKPLSIPRLELLAAVTGVRLMKTVVKAHTIKFRSHTFWSDSKVVLSWLKSDARQYKQFVALRISECLDSSNIQEWRYIPTKLNVADDATKWYSSEHLTTSRWFDGPEFLSLPSTLWPKDETKEKTFEELRAHYHINLTHRTNSQPTILTVNTTHFSSWNKMVRSQGIFERAVHNFKSRANRIVGCLTIKEVRKAEISLFKKAQWETFKEEIVSLSIENKIEASSTLIQYSPILDNNGLLRMEGRIQKARSIRIQTKQPIILPKNHEVTTLLIRYYHHIFLHQNHETIINEIRQKYVIPKLRVLYRQIRSKCQQCKIKFAKPNPPKMASLPLERVEANIKPFTNVGLDFFGPIEVTMGRRTEKRWGALYTCLSIRAIHLELVNSLSTDSCIRSLIRFKARRGTPRRIYSDNATNFRGANNALQYELRNLNYEKIADRFTNIEWRFIPPGSPHFGGAWERLVRVVKSNLFECLPERRTSEEILYTCFTEVESIVNSRPLTHIPIDTEDDEALTPNHFILGSSSGEKPLCEVEDSYFPSPKSWKVSQMFADRFWRRFLREYLPDLSRRTKWYNPVQPLSIGDLVFIVDERNPRGCWPRGKVIDVRTGSDGQVRSATIKTSTGVYMRPSTKLAKLDVSINGQSSPEPDSLDQGRECCGTELVKE